MKILPGNGALGIVAAPSDRAGIFLRGNDSSLREQHREDSDSSTNGILMAVKEQLVRLRRSLTNRCDFVMKKLLDYLQNVFYERRTRIMLGKVTKLG